MHGKDWRPRLANSLDNYYYTKTSNSSASSLLQRTKNKKEKWKKARYKLTWNFLRDEMFRETDLIRISQTFFEAPLWKTQGASIAPWLWAHARTSHRYIAINEEANETWIFPHTSLPSQRYYSILTKWPRSNRIINPELTNEVYTLYT